MALAVNQLSGFGSGGAAGGDPDFANVQLLLHGNGTDGSTTFIDSSSNGFSPSTVGGNAQIDTAQKKFGTGSMLFDGSGDYLDYGDLAALEFGGQDFAIEGHVRFAATSGAPYLCSKLGASGQREWWNQARHTNNDMRFSYSTNGTDLNHNDRGTWIKSTDVWYFWQVIRVGNDLMLGVDGSQLGSTVDITGVTFNTGTNSFHVGGDSGDMNGWIDDLRITVGSHSRTIDGIPTEAFPDF